MKTSSRPSHTTTRDNLDARLSDYASQAAADIGIVGRSRTGAELSFASSEDVLAAPDLAAPGFVSFTGGAHQRSMNFGAPRNVLATQAEVYAELDAGILDLAPGKPTD